MKKNKILTTCISLACALMLAPAACVSGANVTITKPEYSPDSKTLDAAAAEAASYLIARLPDNAKVALGPFDTPSSRLAEYIFEELWGRFENSDKFVMVDRRNLDRIEAELSIQYESGRVDDEHVVSITKQYGAEILVYGQIVPLGGEYRMTVYATDIEKATSSQCVIVIRPDSRLSSLLNTSPDDEVERAVSAMARAVNRRTTVAIGRISYADTQTASNLSAWLKNAITMSTQKHRDKLQVASEDETNELVQASRALTAEGPVAGSPIQAIITGNYSPLDNGADVMLHLVSLDGSKTVLASARFTIPGAELERRKLSLLPEKDKTVISKAEFEAKQQAVVPYAGGNNKWNFTVTPDVLDGMYYDGDSMSMQVYAERDCYFRITHIDVNGNAQVIYPTSARDNFFIKAGQTRRIPDTTLYRMGPPFGEEIILAAAYERPFTPAPQSGPLSADSVTRSMTVESDNHTPMTPSATAKFSYTILPK
jgi:hypothetical protein